MPFESAHPTRKNSDAASVLAALQGRGCLNEMQRAQVEQLRAETGAALDETICRLGFMSEETLADFFSAHFDMVRYRGEKSSQKLLVKLNARFLERYRVAPVVGDADRMFAVMVDPARSEGLAGLSFALGARITPLIATATEFDALMGNAFQSSDPDARASDAELSLDTARLKDLASAEPTVRLANRMIAEASRLRASDIHIEPKERRTEIRYRIDGVLHPQKPLSGAQGLSVISRLKILANLDIAERRRPQDGRFSLAAAGRAIDLRLSTTPTIFGESAVIRLLEKSTVALDLASLGFSADSTERLQRLIQQPNGVILVTGPTGSGKTTTLYALLELLAKRARKILTIEDPVEYQIDGVSQTQVNPAIGLDFANAMRSFLRHDPDVIMVGEMRDLETARTAVQASLTGHLVLSTLHTNDAPSAITRLLDMGIEDYLLGSTLLGVVAQRLVRRVCASCAGAAEKRLACAACCQTGYRGRVAIGELLLVNDAINAALRRGVTAAEIRSIAERDGFRPLACDAADKVGIGVTDAAETGRALGLTP